MILRGLHVEHWRCIRKLDLDALPDGIVILHGPNRTGKSSLVHALRCCLFDCDHNATGRDIKASLPWNGSGPPKVVVEFAIGAVDYRLTKVFSTRKDGTARLEKKEAGGWNVIEDAPKEAARLVRELLGANDSRAGLNQLLWLEQGNVRLPDAAKIDATVQQRLVQVLNVLVTGRDLAFQQELERRYARWFTERGSTFRKSSPVVQAEQRREERLRKRDEEAAQLQARKTAFDQLDALRDDEPQRQKAVEEAERQLASIEEEQARGQIRLHTHAEAERLLHAARQNCQDCDGRAEALRGAQRRHRESDEAVTTARASVDTVQEEYERLHRKHDDLAKLLQEVRQADEQHQRCREEIDDRRKLLELTRCLLQSDETLQAVAQLEAEIASLDQRLRELVAPDDKLLQQLRTSRTRMETLRAQLQAAALTLRIVSRQNGTVAVTLDDQTPESVELATGQTRQWELRQRASIDIAGVGVIELARGRQDLDLERSARELAELERTYRDAVGSLSEDAADAACLDRLAERRLQRDTWTQRLQELRRQLQTRAPQGRAGLESRRLVMESERSAVLERRPDLAAWQPSAADVEARAVDFKTHAAELETRKLEAETAAKLALDRLHKAETQLQKVKEGRASAEATAKASAAELERFGSEAVVQDAVLQARQALADAERKLEETRLTEAEQTVAERCGSAKQALEQRKQQLQSVRDQLNHLRGALQGNEGLHIRVADAEAAVLESDVQLAREKLEADAHRRLRELFEEFRERQVQNVMEPIGHRVLDWARLIGLDSYSNIQFGDRFLPEGLALSNGHSDKVVSLDDESYGTGEQLSLLVRLALGGVLAREEPVMAILDDPLTHADLGKHRRILEIIRLAAAGNLAQAPPSGRMQIVILTCHPDRFKDLSEAVHVDLAARVQREA